MAVSDVREMCESIKYNIMSARENDLKEMKDEILEIVLVLNERIKEVRKC